MKKVLSVCLVVLFAFGLASGALAVRGGSSGTLSDFYILYCDTQGIKFSTLSATTVNVYRQSSLSYQSNVTIWAVLPYDLVSGTFSIPSTFTNSSYFNGLYGIFFRSSDGTELTDKFISAPSLGSSYHISFDSALPCRFVGYSFYCPSGYTTKALTKSQFLYSDFVYDTSSGGSDYDPSLDQDILDGVEAIAQSLLDLETGPYSGVSGVTVDANGDLQHTVVNTASLDGLLNALGIAGTDTNFVVRGMYNNFGSFFTYYDIDDTTNGTTVTVHGLPQYVSALGSELTDGINRLQRDNDILYSAISSVQSSQSGLNTTLQDALYQNNDASPAQSWSVARWLKEIYDSISGFFSNFWSPAETDLKTAAEGAMQAAADNGQVASASDVDDLNDIGQAFSSFASLPGVSPMDAVGVLTDSDYYQFWTQEVEDDLSVPVSQTRGAKSSDVEYIDVLSDHLDTLYSIMGVKRDGK